MIKNKTKLLQIRIENDLLNRLKALADHEGVSVSEFVRNHMAYVCHQFESAMAAKEQRNQ